MIIFTYIISISIKFLDSVILLCVLIPFMNTPIDISTYASFDKEMFKHRFKISQLRQPTQAILNCPTWISNL